MKQAVLLSIQPQLIENICKVIGEAQGVPVYKKRIEVRKTRPSIETPFKCYIYCTLSGSNDIAKDLSKWYREKWYNKKGKIIGSFICNKIDEYSCEFWDDTPDYMSKNHPMEKIQIVDYIDDEDPDWKEYAYITGNEVEQPDDCALCRETCLTYADIRKYMGFGDKTFYGWHISNLKIYDNPKELGEFWRPCPEGIKSCKYKTEALPFQCDAVLKQPPQSWCYVVERLT